MVIVEDNSPDGTIEVATEMQRVLGKEKIIIHSRPGKMGLGSAYIDGLKKCNGMNHYFKYILLFNNDI